MENTLISFFTILDCVALQNFVKDKLDARSWNVRSSPKNGYLIVSLHIILQLAENKLDTYVLCDSICKRENIEPSSRTGILVKRATYGINKALITKVLF